ncbi:hypothetical protein, partial [Candidatus Ichthyocystis sparus]
IPSALFADKETLESYFEVISNLPTKIIYSLYSRLNEIRRSIRYTPLSNSYIDGKYKILLAKVKELAANSKQN